MSTPRTLVEMAEQIAERFADVTTEYKVAKEKCEKFARELGDDKMGEMLGEPRISTVRVVVFGDTINDFPADLVLQHLQQAEDRALEKLMSAAAAILAAHASLGLVAITTDNPPADSYDTRK